LDPPFNSNRSYNVLFKTRSGDEAQAQLEAFDDTWTWSQQSEELYDELVRGGAPARVADAIEAMRRLLGDNDVLTYLVMMTARLVELHPVLKATGSLYLHCDPTASHYLKLLLDAIFGSERFGSEVVWKRTTVHSDTRQGRKLHGHVHDVLLFYVRATSGPGTRSMRPTTRATSTPTTASSKRPRVGGFERSTSPPPSPGVTSGSSPLAPTLATSSSTPSAAAAQPSTPPRS
jgi:hypothetical protein